MLVFSSVKRRVFGALGIASATAIVLLSLSGPADARQSAPSDWPVIDLANPSPGALVPFGDYIISGSAFDPSATQGAGVSRVDLFLGSRDEGGTFLGSAIPGQDTLAGVTPGSALAQGGFQIKVTMPASASGSETFYAYAYSTLTGNETAVSMPVYIGVAPTPVPAGTVVPLPAAEIAYGVPSAAAAGAEMLSLGNPNTGDVVLNGDYFVSGATGSAVDRVQLFLGDRDTGGTLLGTATPVNGTFTLTVTVRSGVTGSHNFVAYARSATGETKVSVPIYVGAAPTPTARPASTS